MAKSVMSLADSKIKSIISMHKKSPEKSTKLSDGLGLYLLIDTKGGKYWRFDYIRPVSKKRSTMALAVYPLVSLSAARVKRDEYRELNSVRKTFQANKMHAHVTVGSNKVV